jgi:hypothetical protein
MIGGLPFATDPITKRAHGTRLTAAPTPVTAIGQPLYKGIISYHRQAVTLLVAPTQREVGIHIVCIIAFVPKWRCVVLIQTLS